MKRHRLVRLQYLPGDRALRLMVWGLAAVVWAFALGLAALRLPLCNSSYATGRVLGALFAGLLVAGVGSIIWNRARRRPPRFTATFLAAAAIVAASIQLAAFAREQRNLDAVLAQGEACFATGTPFRPVHGMTYENAPPAIAAGLEANLPDEVEPLVQMRVAYKGLRPVAIVVAAAIGTDYDDQSSFKAGIMASAGGCPAMLGHHPVVVQRAPGRSMVTGFADCYGIVVVSPSEARARTLFKALTRRPAGPGSPA